MESNDFRIVKIDTYYTKSRFSKVLTNMECQKHPKLLTYLKQFAFNHSKNGLYKTYAFIDENENLMAYISFSLATMENNESLQRKADIPSSLNYPIPALKITRLLVSDNFARRGIGTDLIVLANILALMTAYQVGCKFLIVDAKQEAEKFYLQNNFKPFKINDDNTILMFKTINENMQDDIKQQYIKFCADYSLKSFKTYLKHLI